MKPENATPNKFHKHKILYNNGHFAVAYGIWDHSENRLAMRWNGDEDDDSDVGFPSQGGNPTWFQLPEDDIWTKEIMEAIQRIVSYEKTISELAEKLK